MPHAEMSQSIANGRKRLARRIVAGVGCMSLVSGCNSLGASSGPNLTPAEQLTPSATAKPAATAKRQSLNKTASTPVQPANSKTVLELNYVDPALKQVLPVNVYLPKNTTPEPLIVFAKGRSTFSTMYQKNFFDALTAVGYIVASTGFTDNNLANGPAVTAWPDKAREMSFVLGKLQTEPQLKGRLLNGSVAVVGHSDGGAEALELACDSTVKDNRIKAVVSIAGADAFGTGDCPPLLLIHGTADTINPFASSQAAFDSLSAPTKYLVGLVGAGHDEQLFSNVPPYTQANNGLVISFLNQELRQQTNALPNEVKQLGQLAQLQTS